MILLHSRLQRRPLQGRHRPAELHRLPPWHLLLGQRGLVPALRGRIVRQCAQPDGGHLHRLLRRGLLLVRSPPLIPFTSSLLQPPTCYRLLALDLPLVPFVPHVFCVCYAAPPARPRRKPCAASTAATALRVPALLRSASAALGTLRTRTSAAKAAVRILSRASAARKPAHRTLHLSSLFCLWSQLNFGAQFVIQIWDLTGVRSARDRS